MKLAGKQLAVSSEPMFPSGMPVRPPHPVHRPLSAFTLTELLIVVGLVSVLSVVFISVLGGGGKSVALEAGQSTLVQLVTAARTRALAANTTVRLLVRNRTDAEDYRRLLVVVQNEAGTWRAVDSYQLPANIYVLPHRSRVPSGMYPVASEWRTADNSEVLGSSSLNRAPVTFDFDAGLETWEYLGFTANGTMETGPGSLVVAVGRPASPTESGGSPVILTDPASARGIQVSTYGLPRLINDRTGF
jgi:type II secretory pathway pseudopilin PulG